MAITKIRKRDGRIVDFDAGRIKNAIHKAFVAVELKDGERAENITREVVSLLEEKFKEQIPSVEDAQDFVIEVLRKRGYEKVAVEYEAYRKKKEELRALREEFRIEPKLTVNALEVLNRRYLLKDVTEKIVETPAQMFGRIARAIAKVDKKYGEDPKKSENIFYEMMTRLEFIPNSPTLFNAGTRLGQLSACFVLPVEDSLEGIFTAVKNTALIEKSGGGVGFDFSRLRPKGDIVMSTKGVASGPVSFMRVFDMATEVIKAGGKRRGAMMGILRVDHSDILEFITSKQKPGFLSNFNISVAVTDDFMKALEEDGEYWLVNPRNKEKTAKLKARDVWDLMVKSAWASGDPGVIFIDEINRHNPTPEVGRIESTNPCGEQPLLPYESCNLGSINLSRIVEDGKINWEKLRETIRNAVHFLDNVVDANKYPLKETAKITRANRKIGLGVMGFADMLIKLKIPYDSNEALELAERLMKFIEEEAHKKSQEIAEKRGSFPNFEKSIWKNKYKAFRNATVTTIAPTGSISIIAGCSSGIEPIFAISFIRNVLSGTRLFETNPLFEAIAKERGFYDAKLLEEIAKTGSVQKIDRVPEDVKKLFVTALDIEPEWHVRMQAAFQKYTDNAVSKTVNLPANATVEDVRKVYDLAWKLKCKGVTVFRYGSKPEQVLYIGEIKTPEGKFISAESEYAGGCPTQTCPFPG
ncbi:MAG: vitamin B12-dependent ribonucleotide reductase [Candidatus Bathyarchaeota archaeon]|jgi:ribonucleoside-diphosphate reductase alpha chain|nr:vitamin B12-dependent ribonucleotide reductase [Candidatus Bathyarchaeota archaeon A05DMB-5]MDH7557813.1 vitamin B12-dependent ribonucleotide reductase [Candidatus Bathyarchaeota archaeon]